MSNEETCARCGCYRSAHGEGERCEPVGWTFTPVPEDNDKLIEEIARAICVDVCELPDRTSPDDWPEACLVTSEELFIIVTERLNEALNNESKPVDLGEMTVPEAEVAEIVAAIARRTGSENPHGN